MLYEPPVVITVRAEPVDTGLDAVETILLLASTNCMAFITQVIFGSAQTVRPLTVLSL